MIMAIDLDSMGSLIELKGPICNFEYKGQRNCTIYGRECYGKRFITISAGSVITPMIQILRAIAADVSDPTDCILLSGNRYEEDIPCKIALDTLAKENATRFRVVYTLSSPCGGWAGPKGRLGQELLEAEVGSPTLGGPEIVLLWGPPAMEATVSEVLSKKRLNNRDIIRF